MNQKTLKKAAVPLILAVLLSSLGSLIPQRVTASPASIAITPLEGVVGDTLIVNGTIDTSGGAFTVRWNQILNKTGTAVGNNATISFVIPPTVGAPSPTGRDVTVELIDEALDSVVATTNFKLFTKFDLRVEPLSLPRQLQEGNKTYVKINVTGGLPNTRHSANITVRNPANQNHSSIMLLSNTTTTGSGNGTATYPTNFVRAHTNLTGTYFVSSNVTDGEIAFIVGLTDKTEYRRNEYVQVQAAGYKPSEVAKVDIKTGESSVAGFPKNSTASSAGLITLSWRVPVNATPSMYRIAFTNTTQNGTVKTPSDAQDFKVLGVACFVQAKNLADEAVEGASIEIYNASATTTALNKGNTNSTGWIRFNLDEGNYTFKAFFKDVQISALSNQLILPDTPPLHMQLSLANFLVTVKTEELGAVPLIDVALRFNYTTRDNKTTTETAAGQTNATGMTAIKNLFTNRTYRLEATRYGLLFINTTLDVLPSPEHGWTIRNLTLPNHTLSMHTIDSEDNAAVDVDIRVYEWSSGIATPVDSDTTSSSGDVSFSLPFGRYILRAFKDNDFLSETIVDLNEPKTLTFDLVTLNVNVLVSVLDYFGQPLANLEVRIERKVGQDFVSIPPKSTDAGGSARFSDIVGGDSRVSVYWGGTLVAMETHFLGAGSSDEPVRVAIRAAEYVAIAGYPLQTGAFALLVFIFRSQAVSSRGTACPKDSFGDD